MTDIEKKAIDVIRNHSHKLIDNFTQEDLENREVSIFLAGYHEGNKANEWHYPKDGDLPTHTRPVLVYLSSDDVDIDHYGKRLGWKNHLNEQIITWKEIVLPKEIK